MSFAIADPKILTENEVRYQNAALADENKQLRAALKPFAEAGLSKSARHNDLHGALSGLSMNDLFEARDAYQQQAQEK